MPRSAPTSLSLLPSAAGLPELLYRFLLLLLLASVMPDFGRPYREYPLAFPHPSSKLVHGRLLAGFHAVGSKEGISQGKLELDVDAECWWSSVLGWRSLFWYKIPCWPLTLDDCILAWPLSFDFVSIFWYKNVELVYGSQAWSSSSGTRC